MDRDGVGDLALRESMADELGVFVGDLDAEEVALGRPQRGVLQEQPLAAADFNLQRRLAAEELHRIPRRGELFDLVEMPREVERLVDFWERPTAHSFNHLQKN